MAYKTGNPALKENVFNGLEHVDDSMTVNSTVNKVVLLLGLCVVAAVFGWRSVSVDSSGVVTGFPPILMLSLLVGFGLAILTIFFKRIAMYTAPLYVIAEGIFLGAVSRVFDAEYSGIVLTAVGLTMGIFLCMLVIYKSGIISVTDNFRLGVVAATGGIALYYVASVVVQLFGGNPLPLIYDSGTSGIIFSVFVVIIASLNLVLDFDFIEKGEEAKAPKYMEWYAAFGLMVTLIWLYLEILRLLGKSRN